MNNSIAVSPSLVRGHLAAINAELIELAKIKIVDSFQKIIIDELEKAKILIEIYLDKLPKESESNQEEILAQTQKDEQEYKENSRAFKPEESDLLDKFNEGKFQIVARSYPMLKVFEKIIAFKDASNVLITGDTGTGKELVAN
ncbi:sigma 54-interacting transcriptional regulator, partial [Candidatus Woesearchaeota archaeon]|nr:sigma 54-interacting transcriptional regulator [Bacteroidota bacterium]MBT4207150.1 sigma 54-interacting transcriptional regulator [Candidatus Woesearchaeota archaeon]